MVPSDSRTPRRITSLNRIDEMTTLFYFCAKLRSSFGRSLVVAIILGILTLSGLLAVCCSGCLLGLICNLDDNMHRRLASRDRLSLGSHLILMLTENITKR